MAGILRQGRSAPVSLDLPLLACPTRKGIAMNDLHIQVLRARRRLTGQTFLHAITWCWFAALLLAAVLVGVDARWTPWGTFNEQIANGWYFAGGALVAGLLAALGWTLFTRPKTIEAAIELDKRFALKERVSSALALAPDELESPAGKALVEDAQKRVSNVEVADRFDLKLRPTALLPLASAALALGLAFLPHVSTQDALGKPTDPMLTAAPKKPIGKLPKAFNEQKKDLEKAGIKDPEWMAKLEAQAKDLDKKKDTLTRKDVLKELNNMADELKKRRDELGGDDKLKQQLADRLKDLDRGPADKLAESLGKGDMDKAAKEMEKLKKMMKEGKLDEKAKQDLAKQMNQMQEKIQQMAESHKKMQESLQKQIDEARKNGQTEQAQKMMDQLQKMKQQTPQMQKMQEMASKLGQCQQCVKDGNMKEALENMEKLQADLEQMAKSDAEKQALQDAMDQLAQCKNGMCQGADGKGKKPGNGLGKGQGEGERPEEEEATNTYDTAVKPKMNKGTLIVTGETEGPNIKGDFDKQIKLQIESAIKADPDPLTDQRMSRQYKDHTRDYLNKIRKE